MLLIHGFQSTSVEAGRSLEITRSDWVIVANILIDPAEDVQESDSTLCPTRSSLGVKPRMASLE